MRKVFWENPYQCLLATKVCSVQDSEESTIAYSFAGGQESDRAWVNGIEILNLRIVDSLIFYMLPEDHGLKNNDTVTMMIDWPRQSRLMRLHFAAELVLEIVTEKWGLEKLAAHIAENKARIDFRCESSISTLLPDILSVYNEIIFNALSIEKGYSDVLNQRRY